MKIVVLNNASGVGTSTVAEHLLAPRLQCPITTFDPLAVGTWVENIAAVDATVVDLDARYVNPFINGLKQYRNAHEDIDCFLVPVTPSLNHQQKTITTLKQLHQLGIPRARIRLLFNRIETRPQAECQVLFSFLAKKAIVTVNSKAAIDLTDFYELLLQYRLTISDIANDTTDYRALVLQPIGSIEDKNVWADRYVLQLLAQWAKRNLDTVFYSLFKAKTPNLEVVT